ncbi:MAG: hypothetical protein K2Y27_17510 [Xanthobacteraceae bacterium]|nr:hypothetical protein [Xanthobacteraceae bacterium]
MKMLFKTLFHACAARARRRWQPWLKPGAPSWAAAAIIRSVPGERDDTGAAHTGAYARQWQCALPSALVRGLSRARRPDRRLSAASLFHGAMLIALWSTLFGVVPSGAQARCAEGRTAGGLCANPALSQAMRQTAIIFSQPKISYTAYPVMPSEDARFRYPHELNPNPQQPSAVGTLAPN